MCVSSVDLARYDSNLIIASDFDRFDLRPYFCAGVSRCRILIVFALENVAIFCI